MNDAQYIDIWQKLQKRKSPQDIWEREIYEKDFTGSKIVLNHFGMCSLGTAAPDEQTMGANE
jgi:hypothetical protein